MNAATLRLAKPGPGAAASAANDAPAAASALDQRLSQLIRIEGELRACGSEAELWQHLVNESAALLPFGQALLLLRRGAPGGGWRVAAVSALAEVNRDAPMVRWYERIAQSVDAPAPVRFALPAHADPEDPSTEEAALRQLMWVPVADAGAPASAALLLARKEAWDEGHETLALRLAGAYAHGASALRGRERPASPWRARLRKAAVVAAVAALLLAFVPVPLTTMAPVEVTPQQPFVVAAPYQAVVERMRVAPGAPVKAGDALVQLVDTTQRADFQVASQKLEVARARMLRYQQAAADDPAARRELATAQSEEAVVAAELDYARAMLDKSVIRAERAGIALYGDPRDWQGRPVAVGEAIMRVADPARAEFQVKVPAADAVNLRVGATATIFLDAAPLQPLSATIIRAAYKAEADAAGVASFLVTARIDDERAAADAAVRLGQRGVARIHGEPVSLFFYLLRRPITALRQWTGL